MAINLVSLVSQFLTPQVVGSLARAIGVNEAVAQKLVAAAVPTILASLGTAAAAPGGAQRVSDAISNSDPDVLTKVGQAADGRQRPVPQRRGHPPERPARRRRALEPGGRAKPIFRRAPSRDPDAARRGDASDGRRYRPAGPFKLVGPFCNSFAAQQSEGRDLRRASCGSLKSAWRLWIARRSRRARLRLRLKPPHRRFRVLRPPRARRRAPPRGASSHSAAAATSSGFPMWAIILIVIVVLLAIWWFMSRRHEAGAGEDGHVRRAGSDRIRVARDAFSGRPNHG